MIVDLLEFFFLLVQIISELFCLIIAFYCIIFLMYQFCVLIEYIFRNVELNIFILLRQHLFEDEEEEEIMYEQELKKVSIIKD